MQQDVLLAGADVGSTTVKLALLEPDSGRMVHSAYVRHRADQAGTLRGMLREAHSLFPDRNFRLVLCGSGGQEIASALGAFFTQEVVANGIAVAELYPQTRTAIEIGGQDAKILFLSPAGSAAAGAPSTVTDMRMNGVCAGGTGAFIDQVAELLDVEPDEFGGLAGQGSSIYTISGRCGVFARTDIQPLLNQGVPRADIALSTLHAVARQVIGGLANGTKLQGPVLLEGGPLFFNPALVQAFRDQMEVSEDEVTVPENGTVIVAHGAALSALRLHGSSRCDYRRERLDHIASPSGPRRGARSAHVTPFFADRNECRNFRQRHALHEVVSPAESPGLAGADPIEVYLGIDAGSTTSKFVLLDKEGRVTDRFYSNNGGDPLGTIQKGLATVRERYERAGHRLVVLGAGSTGYGETMVHRAFGLDFHTVETIAHTRAACHYCPDVTFILDIGGQDMKAIYVRDGIPVNFVLNEACSAGCGSFLENCAATLGVPVDRIADLAFMAETPSHLGSRCTVFMNSAIITEQKNGRTVEDILAGLCRAVVENALTKVLRVTNPAVLGKRIVVQGGTFRNDAVFRAFQQKLGTDVIRPPYPGEMGALGIALLTREHMEITDKESAFSFDAAAALKPLFRPASVCGFCSHHCQRSIVEFSPTSRHVAGNRCAKGEIVDEEDREVLKSKLKAAQAQINSVEDLPAFHEKALLRSRVKPIQERPEKIRIGIPRTLEFWDSLPFWKGLFEALGFEVVVSRPSSTEMLEDGIASVSSDTICLPAKMVHGHVRDLIRLNVQRIFNPMMLRVSPENRTSQSGWMCPVIQGYSEVVRIHDRPQEDHGVLYDAPALQWDHVVARDRQIRAYLKRAFGVKRRAANDAIAAADRAQAAFRGDLLAQGARVLSSLGPERFGVVMAGRPYHADSYINHGLARHFTALGIPVLEIDSLPGINEVDLRELRIETNNAFHTRLMAAGIIAARHPHLELVQVVSFGCGHDAILSDELARIMQREAGKVPLVLKLDEGENRGPIAIRVRSFVETVQSARRTRNAATGAIAE